MTSFLLETTHTSLLEGYTQLQHLRGAITKSISNWALNLPVGFTAHHLPLLPSGKPSLRHDGYPEFPSASRRNPHEHGGRAMLPLWKIIFGSLARAARRETMKTPDAKLVRTIGLFTIQALRYLDP